MKTILREHIPYGISLGVYANPQEAIPHLADPHATLHEVPNNLCRKGQEQNLLDYCAAQVGKGFCFDVFRALQRSREEEQNDAKA